MIKMLILCKVWPRSVESNTRKQLLLSVWSLTLLASWLLIVVAAVQAEPAEVTDTWFDNKNRLQTPSPCLELITSGHCEQGSQSSTLLPLFSRRGLCHFFYDTLQCRLFRNGGRTQLSMRYIRCDYESLQKRFVLYELFVRHSRVRRTWKVKMWVLNINDAYCCIGNWWFSGKFDTISLRTPAKTLIRNIVLQPSCKL